MPRGAGSAEVSSYCCHLSHSNVAIVAHLLRHVCFLLMLVWCRCLPSSWHGGSVPWRRRAAKARVFLLVLMY